MEPKLIWGLGLLAASVLLLLVEIFIPTAGVIAIVAITCAVAGIVTLFLHDPVWGLSGLLVMLILGPAIFFYGLNLWRHTPLGRRLIGTVDEESQLAARQAEEKARAELLKLVGKHGEAVTDLRPVGTVVIEGKKYEAMSEMSLIPAGSKVRVTVAEAHQIRVRPAV